MPHQTIGDAYETKSMTKPLEQAGTAKLLSATPA